MGCLDGRLRRERAEEVVKPSRYLCRRNDISEADYLKRVAKP